MVYVEQQDWNGNDVILTNLSSLAAVEIVIWAIPSVTSGEASGYDISVSMDETVSVVLFSYLHWVPRSSQALAHINTLYPFPPRIDISVTSSVFFYQVDSGVDRDKGR